MLPPTAQRDYPLHSGRVTTARAYHSAARRARARRASRASLLEMASERMPPPLLLLFLASAAGDNVLQPPQYVVETAHGEAARHQSICSVDLPVVARACRRAAEGCAAADEVIDAYIKLHRSRLLPAQSSPIVLYEEGSAGWGTSLAEKAGVLLLGVVTGRPVFLYSEPGAYNKAGSIASPEPDAAAALFGSAPLGAAYDTSEAGYEACEASVPKGMLLPYTCKDFAAFDGGRVRAVLPTVEDGDARQTAAKMPWFDRWSRKLNKSTSLEAVVPPGAVAFTSLSLVAGTVLPVLVAAPSSANALDARLRRSLQLAAGAGRPPPTMSARDLARGMGEMAGPACITRMLTSRLSPAVHKLVKATLAPLPRDGLLAALHIRRGDNAMRQECADCIDRNDPDSWSVSAERIESGALSRDLLAVNRSLEAAAAQLRQTVWVFVASDTQASMALARKVLGARVLTVAGRPIHSTQVRRKAAEAGAWAGAADGAQPARGANAVPDLGAKIIADFTLLSLADAHFCLGQSTIGGTAAAVGRLGRATSLTTLTRDASMCPGADAGLETLGSNVLDDEVGSRIGL